jgi:hypothetical protein
MNSLLFDYGLTVFRTNTKLAGQQSFALSFVLKAQLVFP